MIRATDEFLKGFFTPLRGLVVILSSKKNFFLAVLPTVIFFLAVIAVAFAFHSMVDWVGISLATISRYLGVSVQSLKLLGPVLGALFLGGFILVGFVFAYILITLITGPFLSLLSERIFRQDPNIDVKSMKLLVFVRMFVLSLVKGLFFICLAVLNLALSFLAPLNLIGIALVYLGVGYDMMDYALEVDLLSLRQRAKFFFSHFYTFAGIATSIFLTTFLPGIFFVLLPAYVAGATKLYLEIRKREELIAKTS